MKLRKGRYRPLTMNLEVTTTNLRKQRGNSNFQEKVIEINFKYGYRTNNTTGRHFSMENTA